VLDFSEVGALLRPAVNRAWRRLPEVYGIEYRHFDFDVIPFEQYYRHHAVSAVKPSDLALFLGESCSPLEQKQDE
jgi:hypothetical protein